MTALVDRQRRPAARRPARRRVPAARRADRGRRIVPSVQGIAATAAAGSKDLDAVPLLLTTQDQVIRTVENVAAYGGSLDVIVDDDRRGR